MPPDESHPADDWDPRSPEVLADHHYVQDRVRQTTDERPAAIDAILRINGPLLSNRR